MSKSISLILCIALAGIIAWAASRTPAAAPSGRPVFRPARHGRRRGDRRQGPIPSALPNTTGCGTTSSPIWRTGTSTHGSGGARRWSVTMTAARPSSKAANVQDIIAVLPSASPALPAVAIMAHYDSVPLSPGAADDTGRRRGGPGDRAEAEGPRPAGPRRHLPDHRRRGSGPAGRAGLLRRPSAVPRRIGVVLNMESAGGGGRAYMFRDRACQRGDDGSTSTGASQSTRRPAR